MGIGSQCRLLALLLSLDGAAHASAAPTLIRNSDIRRLTPAQADAAHPVRVTGIVTFIIPQGFYLQDSTAGVYVKDAKKDMIREPGVRVTVEGVTKMGEFAPNVMLARARLRGSGQWPEPKRASFERMSTGKEAGQWVETGGVVQEAVPNQDNQAELLVSTGEHRFRAVVPGYPPDRLNTLVDAEVRLIGVCATRFNNKRQFTGFIIRVPLPKFVVIERPAPADAYGISASPIHSLLAFTADNVPQHRARVRGVVTLQRNKNVFIADGTDGLLVLAADNSRAEPGELVDVVGFAAAGEYTPVLENAILRKVGEAALPSPAPVNGDTALSGDFDAELVRIRGVVVDRARHPDAEVLVLKTGFTIYEASLLVPPAQDVAREAGRPFDDIPDGAVLEVVGVCSVTVDENRKPRAFRVLLRSAKDITVLERPPWWTVRHTLALLGFMAVVTLAVIAWVITLRRRVANQTRTIRAALEHEAAVEQRYRDLFENASDVVYTHDLEGNLTSLNKAGETLSGYTREEALRMNVAGIISPAMRERILEVIRRRVEGAHIPAYELDVVTKDGRVRTLEVNTQLICRGGKPVEIEGIARDVTEKKRVKLELERAKEAAEAANRAKSEFLANMSHEIRTPMNGVIGMIELALSTRLDGEQQEYLRTAAESASYLLTVIDDILDFSKIEAGKLVLNPHPFPLRQLLAGSVNLLAQHGREKGLRIEWSAGEDVPDRLFGDSARLRQVLLNLLSNAVKFTPRGSVALSVSLEEAGPDSCLLGFVVRDTGIGIPEDKQSIIFDAFAQADGSTSRRYGGTGLGLAICARLVSMLGGAIAVESRLASGSTFRFTARFGVRQEAGDRRPEQRPRLGSIGRALRILVAEDNPVNQRVAAALLEKRGHRVSLAADGRSAIELFGKERFDMVLMDVQMPGMDGLEATAAIRAVESSASHVPIVAMTAHAMSGDRERCLAAGMDDYLSKPVRPDDLYEKVEKFAGCEAASPVPG